MSMSDPIADMLTRIRNSILRKHVDVKIPFSNIKENILKVLQEEGFIYKYEVTPLKVGKELKVVLKYDKLGRPVVRSIQRVSRPGLRIFKNADEIKPVLNGQGMYVVSTSKGVVSDFVCRKQHIGGEVLCQVY